MSPPTIKTGFMLVKARWGGVMGEYDNYIYLSPQALKLFGIQPDNKICFKTGTAQNTAVVGMVHCSTEYSEPIIFTSPALSRNCQIPTGTAITLKFYPAKGLLCAGPIIGLFTVRNYLPDTEFGSYEQVLAALAESAEKIYGLIFVFCPEDIDWKKSLVTGYIPNLEPISGNQIWKPVTLPLPDTVYDRIPSRSIESMPEVQEAKSWLMLQLQIPYFNPKFLDKWETHELLQNIQEAAPYLPPTKPVYSHEDIRQFLEKYRSVFLKPSSGSLGRRIINIHQRGLNEYQFFFRNRDKQTITGSAAGFTKLIDAITPVMGNKEYIMQKDLHLAKYKGCPFDIRVLAQKDRLGNWRRTKIYVRKAAPENFLSNLSDGGNPESITTVLREVFDADFQADKGIGKDIRQAVNILPTALEEASGMIWAELGLDLGIDHNGRIWLIEINAKPFRSLVSKSGSYKVIERSLMRPLEFAKLLAGFYDHSLNPSQTKGG
ncbi:YheC/YheD family protein [Phosphitispora sp. TUW77]|uniref:YheC/YheD family endospore coat-associated protein n=1 Tax=Phosphitispora sp. TUW77 TaxID=3152361 RepID=UPI003AB7DC63